MLEIENKTTQLVLDFLCWKKLEILALILPCIKVFVFVLLPYCDYKHDLETCKKLFAQNNEYTRDGIDSKFIHLVTIYVFTMGGKGFSCGLVKTN